MELILLSLLPLDVVFMRFGYDRSYFIVSRLVNGLNYLE